MIACNSFEILVSGSVPQTRSFKLGLREKFTLHTDFAYRREGRRLGGMCEEVTPNPTPLSRRAFTPLSSFCKGLLDTAPAPELEEEVQQMHSIS